MTRDKGRLILFTEKFPFIGGEPFLETEIKYLSQAFEQIIIYPKTRGAGYFGILPANVTVHKLEVDDKIRIRRLFSIYGFIMIKYFFNAFFLSRDRLKHIAQFSYTWNYLVGVVKLSYALQKKIEKITSNVVYYSYWYDNWASALVVCKQKGLNVNLVVRAHGYDYDELQNNRGFFPFRGAEISFINRIAQISEYGVGKMKKNYKNAKVELFRLGVNEYGNNPSSQGGNTYKIVSCSNFIPLKRVNLIVDVLSCLTVPFEWVHIGSGEGMISTMKYANTKLKPSTFQFLGQISNTDVINFYKDTSIDLFINLSELEGIPVSLMEAISFGIPVCGCDVCGMPEIVTKETGVLFPKDLDIKETADALSLFLKTKSRNPDVRKAVKTYWKKHFNASVNYGNFIDTLNQKPSV